MKAFDPTAYTPSRCTYPGCLRTIVFEGRCKEHQNQTPTADDEIDHEYTDETVCPYCGKAQSDSWELDGGDGTQCCGYCDREFSYSRHVEVTYSTWAADVDKADAEAVKRYGPAGAGEAKPLRPVHWRRWAVMSPEGDPRRFCLTEGDACDTACGDEDIQEVAIYPVDQEVRVEAGRERFPNLRAAFPISDEKGGSEAMIALEGDLPVSAGGSARLIDEDRHGAPAHYNHDEVCAWIRGYNQAAAERRAASQGEAERAARAENLLLGLHKIVADLAPYFDKPLTEESMPRWLALDSAQKAVAKYFATDKPQ